MNNPPHSVLNFIRRRSIQRLQRMFVLLMVGLMLLMPQLAAGQCLQWTDGPFGGVVAGDDVNDMRTFDLDGGGPQPARLVAATDSGVWVWDMVNWRPLGEGLSRAFVFTVFEGSLVAAGQWIGAQNEAVVVRWNGNGWVQMGGAFTGLPDIRDFAVFQGELIAGGAFTSVGGVPALRVARWNGSAWTGLGPGLDVPVTAMAVFDLDGSGPNAARLIVGGLDGPIPLPFEALWTGSDWIYPPVGPPCTPLDYLVAGGRLYVCGAGPEQGWGGTTEAVLCSWDEGHWRFELQVNQFGGDDWMNRMTEWDGNVVIVGRFEYKGSENVLLFDGSNAAPMLGGRPDFEQRAVCVFGPNVAVARRLHEVAQYNIAAWIPVNATGYGNAFATFGSRLVVGGNFTRNTNEGQVQGVTYNLLGWNGTTRSQVAGGTNGPVRALEGFVSGNDCLVVGGSFTQVGLGISAVSVNNIALRTEPLLIAGTWSPMGTGFNAPVLAVDRAAATQVLDETIYAGGEFTAAGSGSPTFGRIAQWFGSPGAWSAMGNGFNSRVRAIKAYNSGPVGRVIVVGGDFTIAGTVSANCIASWATPALPTSAWSAMGSGFNGSVHAIERYNSATYAAGAFTASGATTVNRLARWTGTAWVPVGNGTGFNNTVRALLVNDGLLYAAGDFTSVDGIPADGIARWNGSAWSDVGLNNNVPILALVSFHGEVHAGIASDDTSLRNLASTPWVTQQPLSQTVTCGGTATFTFAPAPGYTSLTRTWRKNGVPVVGGMTGHGSRIVFNGNSISITNVRGLDAGVYDCVLSSSACASLTSSAATLTVPGACPPCPADTNADGAVNVADLLAVIGAWGPCAPPPACAGDINQSGSVDVSDLLAVIMAWGACP